MLADRRDAIRTQDGCDNEGQRRDFPWSCAGGLVRLLEATGIASETGYGQMVAFGTAFRRHRLRARGQDQIEGIQIARKRY